MATVESTGRNSVSDRSNSITSHQKLSSQETYRIYSRRWLMVFVVSVITLSNAMIWICFSPVTNYTSAYYNITSDQVNWLSMVYVVASVPVGLIAAWLLDTIGLRTSIILAAWLNLVGSLLRNLTTFKIIPANSKYPLLLFGQFLAACAQPFIMFVPTKLAALWFPATQRAKANTLTSMANPLGIMAANLLAPNLVKSTYDLHKLLWICTGVAGIGTLLATFGICSSKPPTPPTASAEEGTEPFFLGLKKLLRVKSYWILFVVFGSGLAVFTAFTTFLEQILCPRDYPNSFSGLCGALLIACGVLGAGISGVLVDKTKRFEEVAKTCYVLSFFWSIVFTEVSRYRNNEIIIAISVGLFGFFGFAAYPVCMEMGVEITYPVAEATSSGLLFISGQIQGLIYMLVSQMISQPLPLIEKNLPSACGTNANISSNSTENFTPQDWTVPNLFLSGVMALFAIIMLLCFHPTYRRLLAERMAQRSDVLNQSIQTLNTTDCEESSEDNQRTN